MKLHFRRIRVRYIGFVLFGIATVMTIAACADTLGGPNSCIFAYSVSPNAISLSVGDSTNVSATPEPGCGGPATVAWRMDDATRATVRTTGPLTAVVRGVAVGNTTLNAENGSRAGFAVVQVR